MKVIRVKGGEFEDDNHLHIEGSMAHEDLTLCGYKHDNLGEWQEINGILDCPDCLAIVRHVKQIKIPRKYYE